jgi:hypothetical protein
VFKQLKNYVAAVGRHSEGKHIKHHFPFNMNIKSLNIPFLILILTITWNATSSQSLEAKKLKAKIPWGNNGGINIWAAYDGDDSVYICRG